MTHRAPWSCALLLFALAGAAGAYESDQLTDRDQPLQDMRGVLNAHMDRLLEIAVRQANRRTRCAAPDRRTKRVLARRVYKLTSRGALVFRRGLLRAPGFTAYSAWIERRPWVDKRDWLVREDLFADVTWRQSFILATAGPSSTVRIGDALVGTDKLDHFLDFGYVAWRKSRDGAHPERVSRFDYRTERFLFGLVTSKTYSYADIAANNDGYDWYRGFLAADSDFQRDGDGCVVLARGFDWGAWADWRYDEALNPSIYTPPVQARISLRIARARERYCAAWEAMGGPAYDAHLAALRAAEGHIPRVRWLDGRPDPFGLGALCAGAGAP